MITLHDALIDGELIGVNTDDIVVYEKEHILPIDGTRVILRDGEQLVVQETVEEIVQLIEGNSKLTSYPDYGHIR